MSAPSFNGSEFSSIVLPTKPDCPIRYTLTKLASIQNQESAVLIVFVNGLGLPQALWQETIALLKSRQEPWKVPAEANIFAFTYDRYGQGLSQPLEGGKANAHDTADVISDLNILIGLVKDTLLAQFAETRLLFVAHSIGVNIARLYCQYYPKTVSGMLFLDSNIANTDFISLLPDPDEASFDEASLPADTTIEQLRWTRENYRRMFHPATPNPENLTRNYIPSLLPLPENPKLIGPDDKLVQLTVVGHDPESFAEESLKISTRGLTEKFMEPAWQGYNRSLLKLGDCGQASDGEVITARGSGHFVQRDNPQCVAREIVLLLNRLVVGKNVL